MMFSFNEVGIALIGAIFGAVIQARREKSKRLRNEVWAVVEDELLKAQYGGDFEQQNNITDWTEVSRVAKKELPSPVRKEFGRYYQVMDSIYEQKGNLEYFQKQMFPQYAENTKLFKLDDGELRVASDRVFIGQEKGFQPIYSVDYDDWLLEYGPVISEAYKSKGDKRIMTGDKIEEVIKAHNPENGDLEGIAETWDAIESSGCWGDIIKNMYGTGGMNRYLSHLQILRQRKLQIAESASDLDEWMSIMINTQIYSSYLIIMKKKIKETMDKCL